MNNAFTAGKSELKIFESALLGVPTVASSTDSYSGCITDGINGFLAASKREWVEKLDKLIKDSSLRLLVAGQAEKDFIKRFDIKSVINDVIDIYKTFTDVKTVCKTAKFIIIDDGIEDGTMESLKEQVCSNWETVSLEKFLERADSDEMVLFPG
jgi:hypothetical protein